MRSFSNARTTLLAFAVVLPGITSADAFEQKKFDPTSFKAAQDSNKSILVDISATWCPVCKKQHQVLAALAKKPEYAGLVVFEVDFDTQKDAVRSFNAQRQSTLIAFKGPQETRRLVAETAAEPIEDLLKSSLKK